MSRVYDDVAFRDRLFTAGWRMYKQADSLPDFRARLARQSATFADLIKRADIKME